MNVFDAPSHQASATVQVFVFKVRRYPCQSLRDFFGLEAVEPPKSSRLSSNCITLSWCRVVNSNMAGGDLNGDLGQASRHAKVFESERSDLVKFTRETEPNFEVLFCSYACVSCKSACLFCQVAAIFFLGVRRDDYPTAWACLQVCRARGRSGGAGADCRTLCPETAIPVNDVFRVVSAACLVHAVNPARGPLFAFDLLT